MRYVGMYAKAVVATAMAGGAMYLARRAGGVTAEEWFEIAGAGLAAGGVTWAVPNKAAQ